MTFAGTPATTVLAGTSFVTTAPAATTEFLPIVTPFAKSGLSNGVAPINNASGDFMERLHSPLSKSQNFKF